MMFVVITTSLCRHSVKRANTTESTLSMVRRHLIIAVVLSILFGLGWAFGLIGTSSLPRDVYLPAQYIFSIFVGMQGVLIIIFHGIRSRDAREEWKRWWSTAAKKSKRYQFFKPGSTTWTVYRKSSTQLSPSGQSDSFQLSPTHQNGSFQLGSISHSDKPALTSNSEKQPIEEEILTSTDREGEGKMPELASC